MGKVRIARGALRQRMRYVHTDNMAAMSTMPDRFVIAFVLPRTGAATDDTGLKISVEWIVDRYRRPSRPSCDGVHAPTGFEPTKRHGCMIAIDIAGLAAPVVIASMLPRGCEPMRRHGCRLAIGIAGLAAPACKVALPTTWQP